MRIGAADLEVLPAEGRSRYKENAILGEIWRQTQGIADRAARVRIALEVVGQFFNSTSLGAWLLEGEELRLRGFSIPDSVPPEAAAGVAAAFTRVRVTDDLPVTRAMHSGEIMQWRANDPSLDRPIQEALGVIGASHLHAFPIRRAGEIVGCGLLGVGARRPLSAEDRRVVAHVFEHIALLDTAPDVSDEGRINAPPPTADSQGLAGRDAGGQASERGPRRHGRPRILLAEHDDVAAEVISHRLEREGMAVLVCHTGAEAVAGFRDFDPDLCLVELVLPGLPGLEWLKQMRGESARPHIPVIVLTTLQNEKNTVRAFALGADDFLTKPLSLAELTARVKRRLRVAPEEPEVA